MSKIIKFRGKKRLSSKPENLDLFAENEKEDEWVYGMYSTGINGFGAYIMPFCYTSGLIEISEEEDEDGDAVIEYGTEVFLGGWIQVHPETVGQFTNSHDENGNEIYENIGGDL